MLRDLEDKMFRGEGDCARREARMAAYRAEVRRRFDVAPDLPPLVHVEIVDSPPCEPYRFDTARQTH